MKDEHLIISEAKEHSLVFTNILEPYQAGTISKITSENLYDVKISLYKINCGKDIFLLKTILCPSSFKQLINELNNEYQLCLFFSKLNENILKPINCKSLEMKSDKRFSSEILYELDGDFINLNEDINGIEIMTKLINPLSLLEMNSLFYAGISTKSVIVKDGVPKIICLDNNTLFDLRCELMRNDKLKRSIYYPPEIFQGCKYSLNKADVYSWGVLLYQFTKKKFLKENITSAEIPSYENLLKELDNIEIKDEKLKKWVVRAITQALNPYPEDRPSFGDLKEIMISEFSKDIIPSTQSSADLSSLEFKCKF